MTRRWPEIRQHLDAVLDLPAAERGVYLDRHCEGDDALRAEIEAYLRHEEAVSLFIETPVADLLAARRTVSREGEHLGPYLLGSPLGQGGMGEVYRATRSDAVFEKEVAVKILKRGLDTGEILRRFERERRILGRLEHPSIARILDGGSTADGLPYFVMERVAGTPINRYCDLEERTLEEVLELFRRVCEAVHAAHKNLVVHCDLKPGNILVAADGTPRLLDFGIAKLLRPASTDQTRIRLRIGTPDYASPEQVRGDPITTASDVYSLGALLYRLLTGQPPPSKDRWPARPSATLTAAGDKARRRRLRGDLDAIVSQAMHPQPGRRYASAHELGEDIRRHQVHRPITARPDSLFYRSARLVRRHPVRVGLSAALMVSAAVFVIVLLHQLRATEAQRDRARGLRDTVLELLATIDPTSGKTSSEETVEAVEKALETELSPVPADRALLLDRMGRIYYRLGFLEAARQRLEESLALWRELPGTPPGTIGSSLNNLALVLIDLGRTAEGTALLEEALTLHHPDDREALITARGNLAKGLEERGKYPEAERIYRRLIDDRREVHGEESEPFARGLNNLAVVLLRQGRLDEAEALLTRALALWRRLRGPEDPQVAVSQLNLAVLLDARGEYRRAVAEHRQALAIRRRHYPQDSPEIARSSAALAFSLLGSGAPDELAEAEARLAGALNIYRQAGRGAHPHALIFQRNLAAVLLARGDAMAAEGLAREVVERCLATLETDHWRIADARSVLGQSLLAQGRWRDAERLLVDSLPVIREATGEHSRYSREAQQRLAELRRHQRASARR